MEAALAEGADPSVMDTLKGALFARANCPEAIQVLGELVAILQEKHETTLVNCLAKDLENGADPDLVGALMDYFKAGMSPGQIGAMAWFFPRSRMLRPASASGNA